MLERQHGDTVHIEPVHEKHDGSTRVTVVSSQTARSSRMLDNIRERR